METIKIFKEFLLRKGFGILRINVFVANSDTKLNGIPVGNRSDFRPIDNHVLTDISLIRGKKKYNQLKRILDRGGYGLSVYRDNKLAAYGWIGVNRKNRKKRTFCSFAIPPHSAHIFECYTLKEFRGQKLYPVVVHKLTQWAISQHVENVYIDTVVGNTAAEKGITNLGFDFRSLQTKFLFFSQIIYEHDNKR